MAASPLYDRMKRELPALLARVPAGRLVTHGVLGRHFGVDPRHIVNLVTGLDDTERGTLPWWRIVADGGAIGRHAQREPQIAALRAEGVPVAPAGIAQDLAARIVTDLTASSQARSTAATAATTAAPARSRGMKSHPTTTVKR
jgi:alkylated DNA nucleotide flippase Atl1